MMPGTKWFYTIMSLIFITLSSPTVAQTLVMDKEYELGNPVTISIGDIPSVPGTLLTTLWEVQGGKYREFDNVLAIWATNNIDGTAKQVNVECIVRLTKKVTIEGTEYELEIPGTFKKLKGTFNVTGPKQPIPPPGPTPPVPTPPGPTPPLPNPTVPEDQFGNIGRAVYGWIAQVPEASRAKRTELAGMYLKASSMALVNRIEDVNKFLQTERVKILNTPQLATDWTSVGAQITADISARSFENRIDLSAYYMALHNGFK